MIETGLGGRLDATNVLKPLLTITTDISRDHMEILGDTFAKLAFEKGGIIKPETPHLIGRLPREATAVIKRICRERKAPLHELTSADYTPRPEQLKLDFHDNRFDLPALTPGMPGRHQLRNAGLAVKAISLLKQYHGVKSSARSIRTGLKKAVWPGRFQIVKRPGQPTLVLDVCHNVGSVGAFVDTFKLVFPGQKTRLLTGFVQRKEHQEMLDLLSNVALSYSVVPLATKRTIDVKELLLTLDWRGIETKRFGRLKSAYNKLLKTATPSDIISIIGSHYLIGEFLEENGWP